MHFFLSCHEHQDAARLEGAVNLARLTECSFYVIIWGLSIEMDRHRILARLHLQGSYHSNLENSNYSEYDQWNINRLIFTNRVTKLQEIHKQTSLHNKTTNQIKICLSNSLVCLFLTSNETSQLALGGDGHLATCSTWITEWSQKLESGDK